MASRYALPGADEIFITQFQ
jgi:clathrin heavy chain